MRTESVEFLKRLVNTPSPSGFEAALPGNGTSGQRVWLDYVKQFADEVGADAYGNCYGVINKGGSPRVMLSGHADEIGLIVSFINAEGYIYLRRIGGVDAAITRAQRLTIHTAKGPVFGVVGSIAPHMQNFAGGEQKPPKIHELFVDIGAKDKKEAQKLVSIGDPATLVDDFQVLRGDRVVARGFDNRIGTFASAEALRLIAEKKSSLKAEVYAVSNVQEEVGLFGARQIAYTLKPDVAVVVDVCHATDIPGVPGTVFGEVKLGKGPSISHGGPAHPAVVARLKEVAKKHKINLQPEASGGAGGTDTDAIFWTRGGIPSALVSLPNRYMHSPVEMIHLKDLEQIAQLLAAFSLSLKKGEKFRSPLQTAAEI
jgi:endoglucanase